MSLSARNSYRQLGSNAYEHLLELATEDGINASSKNEIYGCIFGRDSAITILKTLKFLSSPKVPQTVDKNRLIEICRRSLINLISLQGTTINIESGEEPGKFIHEYRKDKYDHLVSREKPWFVYPDKKLRNYDSIDSTPMALLAIYKFYELTGDNKFLLEVLPAVEKGLNWITTYGDSDQDFLLEYEIHKDRKSGGLLVQSWTDSHSSLRRANGKMPIYPIAPVEVQGYAWLTLKLWADFYKNNTDLKTKYSAFSQGLEDWANSLKKRFNDRFVFEVNGHHFFAQALDGEKNQIRTITGNPLLLLYATHRKNGVSECIVEEKYIPALVKRSFMKDMFDKDAGIRTMSTLSETFNPKQDSYHNGSFWPVLNGMIHEGLMLWNYKLEANKLRHASLKPIAYFKSPIELYIKNEEGQYQEFQGVNGQVSCKIQAWSAAVTMDLAHY